MNSGWTILNPRANLGFLPLILTQDDPDPIDVQADNRYAHGGGWHPFGSSKWQFSPETKTLKYPGDPTFYPLAHLSHPSGEVYFYDSAILCWVRPDGTFSVSRMD